MASIEGPEAEKWKGKYYGLLDKFEKQQSDWVKSEKLLSSALSRISLLAEGVEPQIDSHLQALRVVLKEKFNLYRVEAVLVELLKLVTETEKKSSKNKKMQVELDAVIDMLDGIKLAKEAHKKKSLLVKELKKNPASIKSIAVELQALFKDIAEAGSAAESGGLLAKLFSNKNKAESSESLLLLSEAVASIAWPETQKSQSKKLSLAIAKCSDNENFDELLKSFSKLAKQMSPAGENKTPKLSAGDEETSNINVDSIKKDTLSEFVADLKKNQPAHKSLQSIELSLTDLDDEPALLAQAISQLINLSPSAVSDIEMISEANVTADSMPKMREIFIQLLERLVVPVALLNKVETLKTYLEAGEDKDWQSGMKKIVHFINEVRFYQYQEDGGYEDFLQEITRRLQEMVQFLVNENEEIDKTEKNGSEFNRAVSKEVDYMRQGIESATTLPALQSVVNSRLDAIGEFMKQHRQLEQGRFDSAKDNVAKMQDKIIQLENETNELKVRLEKKNKEAMYDALTEIPNRLFYEKRIKEDIARWKRFDTPLSIAVWDVDKFKSVNDTYGHKAGDKVLKAIAQILNKRIRETDFLARYGGEEFVMLLPGTIEEETLRLANELRKAVEDCAFHYKNEAVNITISCGISGFRTDDTLAKVFERADKALYQAKKSGRNRCVVAGCRTT
ncbi:MAG: GGDEF domain-containing protein [Gammaproteobacteria bacterium]|nr:GGDEF domain-containing protein [Gammaproteobacteria bacterium]